MHTAEQKHSQLRTLLAEYPGAVVAFSGGVDSSFLLAVAHEVLGDQVIGVTAVSELLLPEELDSARSVAALLGVEHLEVPVQPLTLDEVVENLPERCYFCKRLILAHMLDIAHRQGHGIVLEGSHASDAGEYRPGMRAVEELGVKSPLRAAKLGKAEIRALSLQLGLPTHSRPAMPCLATRFPYGSRITSEAVLALQQAEAKLKEYGLSLVRVRHHGNLARLEVDPQQLERALSLRCEIDSLLQQAGFTYAALDLRGYRSGSMDEVFNQPEWKKGGEK